jgi:hypothetical protein
MCYMQSKSTCWIEVCPPLCGALCDVGTALLSSVQLTLLASEFGI